MNNEAKKFLNRVYELRYVDVYGDMGKIPYTDVSNILVYVEKYIKLKYYNIKIDNSNTSKNYTINIKNVMRGLKLFQKFMCDKNIKTLNELLERYSLCELIENIKGLGYICCSELYKLFQHSIDNMRLNTCETIKKFSNYIKSKDDRIEYVHLHSRYTTHCLVAVVVLKDGYVFSDYPLSGYKNYKNEHVKDINNIQIPYIHENICNVICGDYVTRRNVSSHRIIYDIDRSTNMYKLNNAIKSILNNVTHIDEDIAFKHISNLINNAPSILDNIKSLEHGNVDTIIKMLAEFIYLSVSLLKSQNIELASAINIKSKEYNGGIK